MMWSVADRIMKRFSDLTVGTMIVLFHVALADRQTAHASRPLQQSAPDGTRIWRSQISP